MRWLVNDQWPHRVPFTTEGPHMFTASFALASLERALKSIAWSLSSLLIADGTDILSTNWGDRLSVAGMAGVLSILGSIASGGIGGTGPSLANEVISPPAIDPKDEGGYGVVELLVAVILVVLLVYIVVNLFP